MREPSRFGRGQAVPTRAFGVHVRDRDPRWPPEVGLLANPTTRVLDFRHQAAGVKRRSTAMSVQCEFNRG